MAACALLSDADETLGKPDARKRPTRRGHDQYRPGGERGGAAAYFCTRDLSRVFRIGEALEAGMVGLKTGTTSTEVAPFGGIKQSGLGQEGAALGIEEYLETRTLHIGGI